MDIVTLSALEEELRLIKTAEKKKLAIDPVAAAGAMAYGKVMLTNALNRYGHKIPAFRAVAREVAGVGARTAMQGKPMLHGATRAIGAIAGDPKLMSVYEGAHAAAARAKSQGQNLSKLRDMAMESGIAKHYPEAKQYMDFAKDIPLESKGLRKVVDYGFTPVGQVAQDIKGVGQRAASSVGGAIRSGAGKAQAALSSLRPSFMRRK